jgi:two-component system sensor histidine kinase YesM
MKPPRLKSSYKRSMFSRILLLYFIISLATILLLGFVWFRSTNAWLISQTLSYNRQQLESLYKLMESQQLSLKQSQYRLYTYRLEDDKSIYNLLEHFFRVVPYLSAEQMVSLQGQKYALDHYLTTIERPRERDMSLFLFSGPTHHYQDICFTQTNGRINPDVLAQMVWEKVSRSTAAPSRRSVVTVPTFTAEGHNGSMQLYVLFDYIRDEQSPARHIGYIINAYSPSVFDVVLRDFSDPLAGRAYIMDLDGNVLYDSSGAHYGGRHEAFDLIRQHQNQTFDRGSLHTTVLHSELFGFYVVGELNTYSTLSYQKDSYRQIVQVAAIAFLLAALLSALSLRSLKRRVSHLLGAIAAARSDIKARAPLTGSADELDAISLGLNDLLTRIETHIHDAYLYEIRQQDALIHQRDAELYALRSQINPHFLYNTLEAIRLKAHANRDEDTAMMISSLATLFRERIKGSGVILLKQELQACQQIMEIYNVRYDSVIALDEQVDPQLMAAAVLRDTLTPLIENAMIHGVRGVDDIDSYRLIVSARLEEGDLILSVADSGPGLPGEQTEWMNAAFKNGGTYNRYHVGLMNIHGRVNMVYGNGYGLTVSTTPGGGLTVEVRMRMLTLDELNELAAKRL